MTINSPEAPVAAPPGDPRSSRRHLRRWVLAAVGIVITATVAVLAVLAARYQPLTGDGSGGIDSGWPAPLGARTVNNFGGQDGELYIPPQGNRVFTVAEALSNTGFRAVTIEAVSLIAPADQNDESWPFVTAGPSRWQYAVSPPVGGGADVKGFRLQPGRVINVGITVKQTQSCFMANSWVTETHVWVKERFGPFSHWVELPLDEPVVMHQPLPARTPGVTCV